MNVRVSFRRKGRRIDAASCAAAFAVLCLAWPTRGEPAPRDPASLSANANDVLGLSSSAVISLAPPAVAAEEIEINLPIDSASRRILLRPVSVKSEDYRVFLQIEDGSLMRVEPSPSSIYRGQLEGVDGSAVAASWASDGFRARIILPDGGQYWVEPISALVAGANPGDHVIYLNADVLPGGGLCGTFGEAAATASSQTRPPSNVAGGVNGLWIAELGIDADFDFFKLPSFQAQPDPIAAVETHIQSIVNAANIQYERDVFIRHIISTIIIRTAEPDPYFKTCIDGSNEHSACTTSGQCPGGSCGFLADDILLQFANEWRFGQTGVRRDLAQLFTGKSLSGSTIGVAYLGTVCLTGSQYSLVESNCFGCGSFSCKTDLSAHEMGHSWGAGHCGGTDCTPECPDHTMNCTLTCSNQFHPTETIPSIINHRDSRTCLDLGDDLRRVVILPDTNSVSEDATIKFDALADFVFGADQIVSDDAIWSVEPPGIGVISDTGLYNPPEVNGNTCVIIRVSYTNSGETVENFKSIVVVDQDRTFAILNSSPPNGTIDARQPTDLDGARDVGWDAVNITFNGDICLLTAQDFAIVKVGGTAAAPFIASIEKTGARSIHVQLNQAIEPGTWTTVTQGSLSVRLGYLPGDSNGDGFAGPSDILALIDALNGIRPNAPLWSIDIDRSEAAGPPDILRLIDLLNGAGAFDPWLNRSLP